MHVSFAVTTLSTLLRCAFFCGLNAVCEIVWKYHSLHGTVKQLFNCWTLRFFSFIKKILFSNYVSTTTYMASRCRILICIVTQTFLRLPLAESNCSKRPHKSLIFLTWCFPSLDCLKLFLFTLKYAVKNSVLPLSFYF